MWSKERYWNRNIRGRVEQTEKGKTRKDNEDFLYKCKVIFLWMKDKNNLGAHKRAHWKSDFVWLEGRTF